jgi:hypothetical protein
MGVDWSSRGTAKESAKWTVPGAEATWGPVLRDSEREEVDSSFFYFDTELRKNRTTDDCIS